MTPKSPDEYQAQRIEAAAKALCERNEPGPEWQDYIGDAKAALTAADAVPAQSVGDGDLDAAIFDLQSLLIRYDANTLVFKPCSFMDSESFLSKHWQIVHLSLKAAKAYRAQNNQPAVDRK